MEGNQHKKRPFLHSYGNPVFDENAQFGMSFSQTGEVEYRKPTAQLLVDFIRDNIIEPHDEGWLDEDGMFRYAGFLVGWFLGEYVV